MIRKLVLTLIACVIAAPLLADDAPQDATSFTPGATTRTSAGLLGMPTVFLPEGDVAGAVFLFSDKDGWSADETAAAERMRGEGAIVVGVDTTAMFASLERDQADECVYLVAEIEELSHRIQRSLGTPNYHSPIIAGVGTAGALGLAIAAQTPDATMGHTVAVDPTLAVPLLKPLCTDAPRRIVDGGAVYGLAKGDLTNPVDVLYTPAADALSRAHVADLQAQGFTIKAKDAVGSPFEALAARMDRLLTPKAGGDNPLADLPLVELPVTPTHGTMAIIYSGDGGWRDLDKSIGDAFQKDGVPTIGVDSLRYFWSRKEPGQTAADMARIISTYTEAWGVNRVILVGYSFGADVIPGAYNLLPDEEKAAVAEISLLGLSDEADYEISVGAFLGTDSGDAETLPDLRKIKPALIQCIYGEEEDDTVCPKLSGSGAELLKTTGGHHFDGDYGALADKILAGLKRRVALTGFPIAEK